jgi:FtsP/CotA-like multicopper oxidase with cupredoxin domain
MASFLCGNTQMDSSIFLVSKIDVFPQYELHDNSQIRLMGYTSTIGGSINIPSPLIELTEGDSIKIEMWNLSQGPPHTIHLHGLDVNQANDGVPSLSFEVIHDDTGKYEFEVPHPGTYLYHCHETSVLHVQAGMYGMIIVRPASADTLTWENGYSFDKENAWLMSEIDTTWHSDTIINHPHDPSTTTHQILEYKPQHFLVNGKSEWQLDYDPSAIAGNVGEIMYLRLANIGYYGNSIVLPAYLNARIVSSDGRPLPNIEFTDSIEILPGERFGVLLDFNQEFIDSIEIQYFNLNTGNIANSQFIDVSVSGFVGISPQENLPFDFDVFPNPTSGKLSIQIPEQTGKETVVTISSLQGEIILQKTFHSNNLKSINVEMNHLTGGNYFINIRSGDAVSTKKVILIK